MKVKFQLLSSFVFATLFSLGVTGCTLHFDHGTWYSQINNDHLEKHDHSGVFDFSGAGGCDWKYELESWNSNGKEKELVFGVDQPLENNDIVELNVGLQGVTSVKVIPYEDVPADIQSHFQQ